MFNHCSQNFKPYLTWFLFDIKGFHNRELLIGRCPVCKTDIVDLRETRITDGKLFSDVGIKEKATKLVELCKHQVDYTSQDLKLKKCKYRFMRGICWGDNRTVKVGKQKKYRAYAVSFYGRRKLIKEVPLKIILA